MTYSVRSSAEPSGYAPRPASQSRPFVIVSNRLPVTVLLDGPTVRLVPSTGGLATGLGGIHRSSSRPWIGWSGVPLDISASVQHEIDARLGEIGACAVPMSAAEVEGFYGSYANGVLWPVLHDEKPAESASWCTYLKLNRRFADVVLREWRPGDRIWIHDYHLMLLPRLLRERQPGIRVGFFLHSPFPGLESLAALPEAAALIEGMLGSDTIGFHTRGYVERFAEAAEALSGRTVRLASGTGTVELPDRRVRLHFSPMSVDVAGFAARAADPRIHQRVAALRLRGTPLFLGVDRLDPTKGIPQRLAAFGRLLELAPELRGRARLLQVAVPSREQVPAYRRLRADVEASVAALNARYGTASWTPVEYVYAAVDELELAALYRAADVMLVTSLRDGMNLVAKEFVSSRTDELGVLVLSKFAGAAEELGAALLVDPADVEGLASAYLAALEMSPAEQRVRMRRLKASVESHDVRRWASQCLHELDLSPQAPELS